MMTRRDFRRIRCAAVASAVLGGVLTCTASQPPSAPADVALRASRMLDPASGRVSGPSVILVSSAKIVAIVPAAGFDGKSARTVIDLGTATILPGLTDAHVHLQIGGRPLENASRALGAGFTTLVDLGATSDVVLGLRDRINAGALEGPRILAAGLWAGTKNGVCEFGGIGIAGGPDGFRGRVRDNITAGADIIKVCVTGWPADAFARPDAYEIADDALTAAVDESTRQRRLVIAHAISLGGVKASIRAGVRGLAHSAYVDAATARELKARDMFLIPTLASLVSGSEKPAADALRRSLATAYREGVRIVFGTDGGVLPHGQNAAEFEALTSAGVTPLDAIRAATTNAAAALGLADTVGAIDPGRPADIIGVDGDPIADVRALARVVFVMRDGRVVKSPQK
jgi:imidazolonepropionase-like amidohydrolase